MSGSDWIRLPFDLFFTDFQDAPKEKWWWSFKKSWTCFILCFFLYFKKLSNFRGVIFVPFSCCTDQFFRCSESPLQKWPVATKNILKFLVSDLLLRLVYLCMPKGKCWTFLKCGMFSCNLLFRRSTEISAAGCWSFKFDSVLLVYLIGFLRGGGDSPNLP